jgi:hypothetical protein
VTQESWFSLFLISTIKLNKLILVGEGIVHKEESNVQDDALIVGRFFTGKQV